MGRWVNGGNFPNPDRYPESDRMTFVSIPEPELVEDGCRNSWLVSLILARKWKGVSQSDVNSMLLGVKAMDLRTVTEHVIKEPEFRRAAQHLQKIMEAHGGAAAAIELLEGQIS
jgi:hypothetical protein